MKTLIFSFLILLTSNLISAQCTTQFASVYTNDTAYFYSLSNDGNEFIWDFGDGLHDTTPINQVKHVYDVKKNYLVCSKVVFDTCEASACDSVRYDGDCHAEFSYYPVDGTGLKFQFRNHNYTAVDTFVNYSWNFDGIGASTERNPVFTFPGSGAYLVSHFVDKFPAGGCQVSISKIVTVGPGNCEANFRCFSTPPVSSVNPSGVRCVSQSSRSAQDQKLEWFIESLDGLEYDEFAYGERVYFDLGTLNTSTTKVHVRLTQISGTDTCFKDSTLELDKLPTRDPLSVFSMDDDAKVFTVFPNPVHNVLNVESVMMHGSNEVLVIDQWGRNVSVEILEQSDNTLSMDCSSLSSGVYFLGLSHLSGAQFIRFIKYD